ncbi:MAG: hypothetical protein ACLFTN_04530 [Phycisphaerae bacterium]
MHGMFFSLLVLIIVGLLSMGGLIAGADNHPGYGAAAGGIAAGVAILMLALVHLRIHVQKMGLWPDDNNKE